MKKAKKTIEEEWEEEFDEMWNKDFIQYGNGGLNIVLNPSKYKSFVYDVLLSQKKLLREKIKKLMKVKEDEFYGKSEFDHVYEAYRITILGEVLDLLEE